MKIQVAEIFESVSGEVGGFSQGSPTIFIRLAGCHCGCPWCDTEQWQDPTSGKEMEPSDVAMMASVFLWNQVLITGGEPMEQIEALGELIRNVRKKIPGCKVQIETNGTILIEKYWLADYWVVDCKGKDSMGEVPYTFNPGLIRKNMWIKYLVGSLQDLDDAIGFAKVLLDPHRQIDMRPTFAISPILNRVTYQEVQAAIIKSKLPIILNAQLHKIMWVR